LIEVDFTADFRDIVFHIVDPELMVKPANFFGKNLIRDLL
jgi:hypothetical protein